jgi:hypothetical protein
LKFEKIVTLFLSQQLSKDRKLRNFFLIQAILKNKKRVAFDQFKSQAEIAECFRQIAVNFGSTGGRAFSGPGNTEAGRRTLQSSL